MKEIEARLIALGVFLPLLATFFTGLRCWVRYTRRTPFGLDDFLVIVAAFLVWGMGITQILGATVGDLGESIGELPNGEPILDHRTQEFLKNEYAFQIIEKLAFGTVKLSILFLYRRIFVGRIFNIASWAMIAIVSAWSFSFFIATICECNPPSTVWSPNRKAFLTNCIKTVEMLLGFAWSDVFTDVLILALPIPMVLRLQLTMRRKIALLGVFLLGGLTVLAGIARLVFFYRAAADHTGPDVAINTAPTIYWSLVEASLAVVSASLPTIRPLFHGMSPESVIRSIRSRISLHSFHSGGSKVSKGSKGSKYVKPTEDQGSTSSQIAFRDQQGQLHVDHAPDLGGMSQHQSHLQTQIKGVELGEIGRTHSEDVPENRIKVSKTVEQQDRWV